MQLKGLGYESYTLIAKHQVGAIDLYSFHQDDPENGHTGECFAMKGAKVIGHLGWIQQGQRIHVQRVGLSHNKDKGRGIGYCLYAATAHAAYILGIASIASDCRRNTTDAAALVWERMGAKYRSRRPWYIIKANTFDSFNPRIKPA